MKTTISRILFLSMLIFSLAACGGQATEPPRRIPSPSLPSAPICKPASVPSCAGM